MFSFFPVALICLNIYFSFFTFWPLCVSFLRDDYYNDDFVFFFFKRRMTFVCRGVCSVTRSLDRLLRRDKHMSNMEQVATVGLGNSGQMNAVENLNRNFELILFQKKSN